MNEIEFMRGIISGLKIAETIITEASTDDEIVYAIVGAIRALESCIEYRNEKDE